MAQHSVKIDDKVYTKLKLYCDLNKESVHKISNEAIEEYLNMLQFGDAPFFDYRRENRQNSPNTELEIDKNTEKVEKEETISAKTPSFDGIINELGIKKIEVAPIPIPTKDAENKLIEILSTHQDGETKPRGKRRL